MHHIASGLHKREHIAAHYHPPCGIVIDVLAEDEKPQRRQQKDKQKIVKRGPGQEPVHVDYNNKWTGDILIYFEAKI